LSDILITVIMSVYNGETYLDKAIKSILEQSYSDLEFVIVNDGSTDNSLQIIEKYARIDNRIIVINQENMGLAKALNNAIEKSSGEYIARMDADDISTPLRFENFINYIKENDNVDLYSTPSYIIDEDDHIKKIIPNYFARNGFNQKKLNYYNCIIHGTLIIRSNLLKKFKYNEKFRYSQDFELYHRLARNGYYINYDNNNITYKLRTHMKSVSKSHNLEQLLLYKQIFK
jgi:glycosyltransferase involved in cell wall biosynthesis